MRAPDANKGRTSEPDVQPTCPTADRVNSRATIRTQAPTQSVAIAAYDDPLGYPTSGSGHY